MELQSWQQTSLFWKLMLLIYRDTCNKFHFIKTHNYEISHKTIVSLPSLLTLKMTKYIIYICININIYT